MTTHATNNSDFEATAAVVAGSVAANLNSNAATTCTFSPAANEYTQQPLQQQAPQQQFQQLQPATTQPKHSNYHEHYYLHQMQQQQQHQHHQQQQEQQQFPNSTPSPPPPLPLAPHSHFDENGFVAAASANSGSATFNGNADAAAVISSSTVAENFNANNGNFSSVVTYGTNGNSNLMSAIFSKAITTTTTTMLTPDSIAYANPAQGNNSRLETASNAGSSSLNGSIKKSSSSSHASREDITSLGGGSSINSQTTAMHNNTNNENNNLINNKTNTNCNYTKYNSPQGYYNDIGHENYEDDGLGPLPPKWETAYTERGELYFIDHNTGTSHWLDPRLSKFQKKSLEDCSDDELPYGWEKIEDSLYGTYFIDHVNRRTQYENPVLEAKRRAAEQRKQLQPPPPPHVLDEYSSSVDDGQHCPHPPPPPPPPVSAMSEKAAAAASATMLPYKFTRNPSEMQGERITTTLVKSTRGLGITIVGGDDTVEEFLQIKSVVPNGPAWMDGQLRTGDILVYVNDTCVLGFSHHEMVNVFQSILPGEVVSLEICRGYPLPFDPNDPNTEVVTTIAVDGITTEPEKQRRILLDLNMDGNYNFLDVSDDVARTAAHKNSTDPQKSEFILMKKPEVLSFSIVKGVMGFGFTIADSAYGQKVKKILDRNCCKQLQEGDILLEINSLSVRNKTHTEVVQVLKECSKTMPTIVKIQRNLSNGGGPHIQHSIAGNVTKLRKNFMGNNNSSSKKSNSNSLYRSKTPTADLYSTQQKEILPIRSKTPLVDTRARVQTPNNELNDAEVAAATNGIDSIDMCAVTPLEGRPMVAAPANSRISPQTDTDDKSMDILHKLDAIQQDIPFMDPYPKLVTSLSERLAEATLAGNSGAAHKTQINSAGHAESLYNHDFMPALRHSSGADGSGGYNGTCGLSSMSMPPNLNAAHYTSAPQHAAAALYTSASAAAGMHLMTTATPAPTYHHESCYCYDCQDYQRYKYRQHQQQLQMQHHHQQMQLPQTHATNYYTLQQQQHQPLYTPILQTAQTKSTSGTPLQAAHIQNERMQKRVNELLNDRRKVGFSPLETHHIPGLTGTITQQQSPAADMSQQLHPNWSYNHNILQPVIGAQQGIGGTLDNSSGGLTPLLHQHQLEEDEPHQYELTEVTLERQALGFGFRIVGGTEEGSQVTVGHIVPGGAADNDQRIASGDEILSIDGINVVNSSHHKVVSLMGEAAMRGQVNMLLRRRTLRPMVHSMNDAAHPRIPVMRYPYDVIVSRHENEGFGFVIISSANQYYGSAIGKLISGSPADRCGELKVGDRIVAVNRIEIAGMSHGDVVQLIKESGLHVRLTIGSPNDSNPMLSTSAQASPGSHLSPAQQMSPMMTTAPATMPSTLQSNRMHLKQHPQQQQQPSLQQAQSQTATYFERTAQMMQHPQL